MSPPERVTIVRSQISACDTAGALDCVESGLREGTGGYVCFTNVHTTVMGRRDSQIRAVTNRSFLSLADGKPIYWLGRFRAGRRLGHVPGPDFMLAALKRFPDRPHFLYGSTPAVLARLTQELRAQVPGLNICGTFSPPFRVLTEADKAEHLEIIRRSNAQFVWVGLGAPKQERWMSECWQALAPAMLFGVGAAFDFHAGVIRRAPRLMRDLGLEWLHRLATEPHRLGRRYLVTNGLFLWYLLRELLTRDVPVHRRGES
jgi:N-acetylglucosaminyldiphosphoundecaprenol N-acetyl-beta-D-mannosaminyltransferase